MSIKSKVKLFLNESSTFEKLGFSKVSEFYFIKKTQSDLLGISIQFYRERFTINIGLNPLELKPLILYSDKIDNIMDTAYYSLQGRFLFIEEGKDRWLDSCEELSEILIKASSFLEKVSQKYKEIVLSFNKKDFEREDVIEYFDSKLFNMCVDPIFALYLLVYFSQDRIFYKDLIENEIELQHKDVQYFHEKAFKDLLK